MRATVEIDDELWAKLKELAARRGDRGYSGRRAAATEGTRRCYRTLSVPICGHSATRK
jgi:hypothetical protein